MNPSQTIYREEQTQSEIHTTTWIVELPLFIFLACLANPFAFIGPYRFPQILLCLSAWLLLSKRYSIQELRKQLGLPPARILRWIYFGTLIITGWPIMMESDSSLLRPVRYSVHYYGYGLNENTDDEGRATAYASEVICKGPYRLDGPRSYDGSNEVPEEIGGESLEGEMERKHFFFWEASGTERAKDNVSLPVRGIYHLLNELVSYTLPDFILMCILAASLSFHRKTRASLRFLAAALTEFRNKPVNAAHLPNYSF